MEERDRVHANRKPLLPRGRDGVVSMTSSSAPNLDTCPILTEASEGILVVTITRPPANAIDAAASRMLAKIFADFDSDRSLRAMIITGGASRFFSGGWDLKSAEAADQDHGEGGFAGLK